MFRSVLTQPRKRTRTKVRAKLFCKSVANFSQVANNDDVVVIGAGIAGVNCAYHLAHDFKLNVTVVDERPPLTLTSSMSTEAYRNFWADKTMTQFMNRTIDLMFARARRCNNSFSLSQHGYAFVTANEKKAVTHVDEVYQNENFGTGPVTEVDAHIFKNVSKLKASLHVDPLKDNVNGVTLVSGRTAIKEVFPYVTEDAISVVFARKCGWVNAQQMGSQVIKEAKENRVKFVRGKVLSVDTDKANNHSMRVKTEFMETWTPKCVVNACGPYVQQVNSLFKGSTPLPIRNDVHSKVVMKDIYNVIPSNAPLMIWDDPINFPWTAEEKEQLKEMGGIASKLTETLPPGVHLRPYPGGYIVMLWDFVHAHLEVPENPPERIFFEKLYPEIVLRGLSVMIPDLAKYIDSIPPGTTVDGGYYTKTPDNKPVIGPTNIPNYFLCSAFSGYGIMAGAAAGELLALHVAKSPLPSYAPAFLPLRFQDPTYQVSKNMREL